MPGIVKYFLSSDSLKQDPMNKLNITFALLCISMLSFAQTRNFLDQPYLETTAKVDTLVNPDLIYLDILISEKDDKNRVSTEEMESKMISLFESLGIDVGKQLTLSDLASNYKKYFLRQKGILKDKAYRLEVYDAQTAGKVLVELEEIGISNVSLYKTDYSKMEDLRLELKTRAVLKARKQAEHLVMPLDQKITRALHISDTYYERFSTEASLDEVVIVGYAPKTKEEYKPPSIEFKPIKVESQVSIKFGLE